MVTSHSWRSAIVERLRSLMPASNLRGRFAWFQESQWSTVRMEQSAFDGGILCLLRSDWSLRWLDVCICTDASEKGFAFAVRERCRELASKIERLSERTRFRSTSRSFQFGRGCDVACSKVSHSSCAPVTFVGYLWGLVGSQFLDESQMQWSSAHSGAKACQGTNSQVCEVMPK